MTLRSLLIVLFWIGICTASVAERPVLETRDGNLVIASAKDRNITLLTVGNSTVNINDIDLVKVSLRAQKAAWDVEKWQTGYLRDLTTKVEDIIETIDGPDGLQYRLRVLEFAANKLANSSEKISSTSRGSQTNDHDKVSKIDLLHLSNRVDKLQQKLRTITTKLGQNECATNPCKNGGTCVKIYNGFQCICPSNWQGQSCTEDIDECQIFAGTALGCQNAASCTNLPGSFRCNCLNGWHGVHCDTNSSSCNIRNSRKLCGHGECGVTADNEWGYFCDCDQGWRSERSHPACTEDIDECIEGHSKCFLEPLVPCINLPGGYKCGSCPPGYTGNGHQCFDIDECLVDNGGCSTEPMVDCENTVGSRLCGDCPSGYQGDGMSCTYVGLCKINNGGCHPRATCIESNVFTNLSPECSCPAGYQGDGIGPEGCLLGTKEEGNSCASNPCVHGLCLSWVNEYHCFCQDGFTGTHCETPIDPCAPNPCENDGICKSEDPKTFTCECTSNFLGPRCENSRQPCGGFFRNPSGTLRYPITDGSVKEVVECAYIIVVDKSKVLNITFLEFDVEPSENCESTFLQINDGDNDGAHRLGRYCNSSLPLDRSFTTTHNAVYILLRSSNRMDRRNFHLRWESLTPECGGLLTSDHGTFSSPGFPGKYPINRDCIWQVNVKTGKRIQFHFFSLKMEQHPTCDNDYLEITETTNDREIQLGRFCNDSHPPPLLTSGSFAKVHFHSDASGNDMGFQMGYSIVEGLPGCGGVFTADHGVITSPGYPAKFPPNTICEWKIQLQRGLRVRLTWMTLDLDPTSNCKFDSVKIFSGADTESPVVGKYCGKHVPKAVTISSNVVLIVFMSQNPYEEHQGFQLKYEAICGAEFREPSGVISSLYYPDDYPERSTCIYEIIQPPNLRIVFSIVDMDIPGDRPCYGDRLEIFDGDSEKSPRLGKVCGSHEHIQPYFLSHNFMYLKFTTLEGHSGNRGFLANYTTFSHNCGGIWTAQTGSITNAVGSNEGECTWIIKAPEGHVVQINFEEFDLVSQGSDCSDMYVALYDGVIGSGQEIGRYCSTPPPMITSQGSIISIVHNSRVMLEGDFELHYTFIDATRACGGHYFTSTGLITTPNYPKPYPMHTSCEWVITVPNKNQITLNVRDFMIEYRSDCTSDFLEVRAGGREASILIGKYCGKSIPKTLKSFTNQMYLKFVSHSNDHRGFNIEWDSSTYGCGGTLTGSDGEIFSPNYPQPYHHLASCLWKIRTNAGNRIRLIFVDLDIDDDESCSSDYIEISPGLEDHRGNYTRYCHKPPLPVDLDSNLATIRFRSDHKNSGRGFHVVYESSCVHKVRGFKGIIESPNFPNKYPGPANCSWIIEAPKGNKINITFSHFSLPVVASTENCSFDYLSVSEGADDSPNDQLGRFCHKNQPPERISSTQNQVFLHFQASEFFDYDGFRLEWTVVGCGGHLTRPSGDFSSPDYPQADLKTVECEWLIEVDNGHSVEIILSDLNLDNVEVCRSNKVQLFGGFDANAPILATVCYSNSPIKFTSPTNKMLVKFVGNTKTSTRGWKATYKSVPLVCGGAFRASKGIIQSTNYPLNYPINQNCDWLIQVDKNHVVNLTFTNFDIADTNNCVDNYVKVLDGSSRDSWLLGTFCSNELPPSILSTGNSLLVVMRSDSRITAKGFKAQFEKACGARIVTNETGVLEAAFDPQTSGTNRLCSWTIVASDPADHVTLSFSHMGITGGLSLNCVDHYVAVYEGESADRLEYLKSCSGEVPAPITSAGNALTVELFGDNHDRFAASYSVIDSACGGEHLSATGTIASPGYPNDYPNNAECVWLLKSSPGNGLRLIFSRFQLEPSPNCDRHYLEIRQDSAIGKLVGTYCNDQPPPIESLTNLWIKFRTDSTGTAWGFLATYDVITHLELTGTRGEVSSPVYPYPWKGDDVMSWRITVNRFMAIRVEFDDVHILSDSNDMLELAIYDGYDDEGSKLASVSGLLPPKEPIVSFSNVIFLKFGEGYNNGVGNWFHLNWYEVPNVPGERANTMTNFSDCGFEYALTSSEENSVMFTSPGWPEPYKNDLDCTWVIRSPPGYHLFMKFLALDLEVADNCAADYVAVYNGNGLTTALDDSKILIKACRDVESYGTIEGNTVMTVKFHSDIFLRGLGFMATVWRGCGGEYTGPNGVISSDYLWNRHDQDTPNITCEWTITVPRGRTIEVKFDEFSVENNGNTGCNENYVLLKNGAGPDSPLLGAGKFCDQSKLPARLETTGNKVYLKVTGFQQKLNFNISYREVRMNCGGSFRLDKTNSEVTFNSPNYPNIPPSFSECVWTFLAPAGDRLTLHFVDRFDLTANPNCTKEYVEVRDGGTEYSEPLGVYCGNTAPSSITTVGNMMYVRFYTDASDPKNGFNATVTSGEVCGRLLRGETGVVTSPNYPHPYPVDQECSWTIVGPPDHTLAMEYQDFNLPSLDNCEDTDYVEITQKSLFTSSVTSLGRWCGTNNPTSVQTSSNVAVVSFHSDNKTNYGYRGFSLNYTASEETCGGELSGPSGDFQTTGYPNPRMGSRSCKWSITGPSGSYVTLEIPDLYKILQRSRLAFYNDKGAKSEIKSFDKFPNVNEVSSSSNYMLVAYQSSAGDRGFKAHFTVSESASCGGLLNNDFGSLLPPVTPFNDSSFFCQWKLRAPDLILDSGNGSTLTVSVTGSFGEFTRRSRTCEDQMKYISVSDSHQKIGMACGDMTNETQIFRSPSPVNIINVMNGSLGGSVSFQVDYYWKACGGILVGPSHTITSPKDMTYPKSCVWQVEYDDPGAVISMDFKRIDLGPCDKGHILVRNGGPLSPIIDSYCGDTVPGTIISSANALWIEYWAAEPPGEFEFELNLVSGSCGGAIRGPNKEITSPGFPKQYPNNAECTWEITVDPGFTVGLIFVDRFNLETSNGCANDFVQVFNWVFDAAGTSGWDDGVKYCGRNAPLPFNSTSNRVKVLFRSNDAVQGDGFRAIWEQNCGGIFEAMGQVQWIQSPHFPNAYPPNQICNYTIEAPQDKELLISFTDFEIEGPDIFGQCRFDNITTTGNREFGYHRLYTDIGRVRCGNGLPPLLYATGRMNIVFRSDHHMENRGYRFQYLLTECGGEITKPTQIRPPKKTIDEYYDRFNCTWIIRAPPQKIVVLRFEQLDLSLSFGCVTNEARAVEGDTLETMESLVRVCGPSLNIPPFVKSVGNVMTVMFRSDGRRGSGNMSAMVTFSNSEADGCGGKIRLESPLPFTSQRTAIYEPLQDCQWKITAESGKNIRLTINRMDLKNSTSAFANTDGSCNGDFLEVRDGGGSNNELIGRYCGNHVPPPITSSTNALWIRFFTDSSGEGEGVNAVLEPIDSPCGKHFWEIEEKAVVIESPGYPADFPAGIQCRWIFKGSQPFSQLRIYFDHMDMEDTLGCEGDRLEINYDITNYLSKDDHKDDPIYFRRHNLDYLARMHTFEHEPFKYCGQTTWMEHYSGSDEFHVLLRSTAENLPKPRKFRFEVEKASCNRNYTAEQGRIIHRAITECWTTITAPPNHTISLYFNYFAFYREDCSISYLKVHDGDFSSNETTLCGGMDADPIFSTGNKLSLHGRSNSHIHYFGSPRYDIQYTTTDKGRGCGGKLYNYEGIFTSPMYPSNYRKDGICEWEIKVPGGYRILMEFLFFDLGAQEDDCSKHHLKIREKDNVEVHCPGPIPDKYISYGNKLNVVYASSVNNNGTGWKIRVAATLANRNDEEESSDYSIMDYI